MFLLFTIIRPKLHWEFMCFYNKNIHCTLRQNIVTKSPKNNIQVTKFDFSACPATDAIIEMICNPKFETHEIRAHNFKKAERKVLIFLMEKFPGIFFRFQDEWGNGLRKKSWAVSSLHQICYQVHFCRRGQMFSIAGYDLAEDKIIYLWDVKRHERAIDVEKERKAKEAAFSSRARRITFIKLRETCIARRAACAAQTVASWLPGCRVQQAPPLLPPSAPPRRAAPRIMPMRFSRRWAPSRRQLGQSVGRSSSIVRCDGVATATTQHASIYPSTLSLPLS